MDGMVIQGKVGMVNHGKVNNGLIMVEGMIESMVVIKDVVVGMMIKDIVVVTPSTLSTPSATPLIGAIITRCKRRRRRRDKLIYGIMIVVINVINSAMGGPRSRKLCQHTERLLI